MPSIPLPAQFGVGLYFIWDQDKILPRNPPTSHTKFILFITIISHYIAKSPDRLRLECVLAERFRKALTVQYDLTFIIIAKSCPYGQDFSKFKGSNPPADGQNSKKYKNTKFLIFKLAQAED
jgi:hypothetical protein